MAELTLNQKQKIGDSIKKIIKKGTYFEVNEGQPYEKELFFKVDNLYYSVIEESEDLNIFNLIFFGREEINTVIDVFSFENAENSFNAIQGYYDQGKSLFQFAFGDNIEMKRPETISDLVDSAYYDGEHYFFKMELKIKNKGIKIIVYFDTYLDLKNNKAFFNNRYYLGNESLNIDKEYPSFETLIDDFKKYYILNPLQKKHEDVLPSDSAVLHIINN